MESDVNNDGTLTFKEVEKLMHKLNFKISSAHLRTIFKLCDKDGNQKIDFEEF